MVPRPPCPPIPPLESQTHQLAVDSMGKKKRDPDLAKKKKIPGEGSWVKGSKLLLVNAYMDQWQSVYGDLPKAGKFYDRITLIWVTMYGYDLPREVDGPRLCEPDDVPAGTFPTFDVSVPKEEVTRRIKIYKGIRDVRTYFFIGKPLAHWYAETSKVVPAPWQAS